MTTATSNDCAPEPQGATQNEPHTLPRLTICEVPVRSKPLLGKIRVYRYAAAGTLIGVLIGLSLGVGTWLSGPLAHARSSMNAAGVVSAAENAARAPKDFGTSDSDVTGLRGHLVANWNDELNYDLTIKPADPAGRAAFALTVSQPPRPLSFHVRLLDSIGGTLCDRQIGMVSGEASLMAETVDASAATPDVKAPTAGAMDTAAGDPAAALVLDRDMAQFEKHETVETENGADGQIESIHARGQMPCSRQAWQRASSWSLAPDFPTLAEQNELLKQQSDAVAAAHKAAARKPSADRKIDARKAIAAFKPL